VWNAITLQAAQPVSAGHERQARHRLMKLYKERKIACASILDP